MKADGSITVGLLYRGPVRRFLMEAQFHNQVTEWVEIKGFLDSRFLVKGAMQSVCSQIEAWVNDVNVQVV